MEFISDGHFSHIKELLYVNTNSKGKQSWNKNKDIYIFTCFWWPFLILMLKNPIFLCRVKIPSQQLLRFLSFMNIFRSSRSQMFLKIEAQKNFAIFWIKKILQHSCFPVNIMKFLTAFLQNFSSGCFSYFAKIWMLSDF